METKPHGWAGTLTGKMLHYFGLTREGSEAYRPDGSPLAMCHNALVKDMGEGFKPDPAPDRKRCDSCTKYLAQCAKTAKLLATPATEVLKRGQYRTVLRGQFKGLTVEVQTEDKDFPGFWWCWYTKGTGAKVHQADVMLSASQLGQPVTK